MFRKQFSACAMIAICLFFSAFLGAAESAPKLLFEIGSEGSGKGEFRLPWGVAADESGTVYVADRDNNRIQKFDSRGRYLAQQVHDRPLFLAIDGRNGALYVADIENLTKYDAKGKRIASWKGVSVGGIAVDSFGYVYITDFAGHAVRKMSPEGVMVGRWGSEGFGDSNFHYPSGIGVDDLGNVYVVDYMREVRKFTSNGEFVRRWSLYGGKHAVSGRHSSETDYSGTGPHHLSLTSDRHGNVYAEYAPPTGSALLKFDADGRFLLSFNRKSDQEVGSCNLATDKNGNVYVTESFLNVDSPSDSLYRLKKFKP